MKRTRPFRKAASLVSILRNGQVRPSFPTLEVLEDRSLLSSFYLVTDPSDNAGSASDVTLRYAVAQAVLHNQTAVIDFSPLLAGQTITLTHTQTYTGLFGATGLAIGGTTDVTIDGSGAPGLTIASSALRLFAVYRSASLSLDHLTLQGGTAITSSGGAVYDSGTLTANDCTFANNFAGSAGAILVHTDTPQFPASAVIGDCTFTNNAALFNGGAIFVAISSTLTVSGSTFDGNSATSGGGIYCFDGTAILTDSTFFENSASGSEASSGGGVYNLLGSLTVSNCTFSENFATGFGGAISDDTATFVLNNSILANSPSGGDLFEATPFLSTVSGGNDLIGDGSFLSEFSNSLSGNAGLDPLGLQNNGGPTETIALLSSSQAIAAGSNALIPPGVTTDQRGAARTAGGTTDIGAYQFVPAAGTRTGLTSSENPSTRGDSVTFTATVAAQSSGPAVGTVTFFIDGTSAATVSLVNGVAIFSTDSLSPGSHLITARYNGGLFNFQTLDASSSDPLTEVVNAPATPLAPITSPLPGRIVVETLTALTSISLSGPASNTNAGSTELFYSPTFPIYPVHTQSMTYVLALRDGACGGQPSEIDLNAVQAPKAQPEASAANAAFLSLDSVFAELF